MGGGTVLGQSGHRFSRLSALGSRALSPSALSALSVFFSLLLVFVASPWDILQGPSLPPAFQSVIIRYFDALRACFGPDEAYPVLIVDANAVLTFTVTLQRFQPISRRDPKRFQSGYGVKLVELSSRDLPELLRARPSRGLAVDSVEYVLGSLVVKALNHLIFSSRRLVEIIASV